MSVSVAFGTNTQKTSPCSKATPLSQCVTSEETRIKAVAELGARMKHPCAPSRKLCVRIKNTKWKCCCLQLATSSTRCCPHLLATPKIVRCRTGHERIHRARHFHYGSVNGKSNAGLKMTAVSLAWLAKYHAERNLGKLQAERHYEVPSQHAHVK